ncbi:MAG: cation diffusion facilitator family transporter [Candidatus Omnitrophota bacterium]
MLNQQERYFAGRKNTLVALAINVGLFVFKMIAGVLGRSQAMVTDAFETLADIVATVVVLFGLRVAAQPKDIDHPYGHGKFETMAAAVCTVFLLVFGFAFMYRGVFSALTHYRTIPTFLPLIAAVFSIVFKEGLYRYTIRVGLRINSSALIVNAWHHRSDAISSIPTFLGILGAKIGFPFMDPLAAAITSIFILRIGLNIGQGVFAELVESSVEEPTLNQIQAVVSSVKDVRRVHDLAARRLGPDILVEMHILVDGNLSVQKGHQIADEVEHHLKQQVSGVSRVTIHVDPIGRLT